MSQSVNYSCRHDAYGRAQDLRSQVAALSQMNRAHPISLRCTILADNWSRSERGAVHSEARAMKGGVCHTNGALIEARFTCMARCGGS